MANQKMTPRQKMINMMYLVLIAMLALNVSREILKSFHLFELSFVNANKSNDLRNDQMMNRFSEGMKNERTKARTKEWHQVAVETRNISKLFCDYIESMKLSIIANGGGRIEAAKSKLLQELKRPDDIESHAHFFMKEGLANGDKLKNKINQVRLELASKVRKARYGLAIEKSIEASSQLRAIDPPTENGVAISWSNLYLESAPLAGVVTLLTKIQSDCKAMESEVLSVLNENININSLLNDAQIAMIIPESQSVMSGERFNAKVALVTYDTRTASKILVNGQLVEVKNGMGHISLPALGTGEHVITASIESSDPKTGMPIMVNSSPITWNSYDATATISADNMNVLFFGLKNPMSISIPGVTPENTIVSANNGVTLSKIGAGKYIATVTGNNKEAQVSVKAKMADGSIKNMGTVSYKLRKVPKPKLTFGNLESGEYAKSAIMAQRFMYAVLEDFYFKDVSFKITQFSAGFYYKKDNLVEYKKLKSQSLSELTSSIKKCKSGDIIFIDEVRANGPNGEIRLDPITIKVK